MKRFCLSLYALFFFFPFLSAQDSCTLRVSLLTCSPGNEMYSTWGHTAIRVKDAKTGDDYIFNYGTFEFTPDFNKKFVKGNLLYSLSVEQFDSFINEYRMENRSISEQELLVSCEEKQKIYQALQVNADGNNRFYLYNFLFDNCTTRARDIILANMNSMASFKLILPVPVPTFRDLIHIYLDKEKEYWSKLGIDILLGARLDKKPSNMQGMFLPDYLMSAFGSAAYRNRPLVGNTSPLLSMQENILPVSPLTTPMVVFSFIFLLILFLSFSKNTRVRRVLVIFDFIFFLLLGVSGIFLLFMWFGTAHKECGNNYNLLWALPTNSIMAFFVHRNTSFVKRYFLFVCIISILLLALWSFLPQQLNFALFPIIFLIIFRSWHLSKFYYAGKANRIQP